MNTLRLAGVDFPDGQDPLGMWALSSTARHTFSGESTPVPENTLVWQVHMDRATVHSRIDMRHHYDKAIAVSRQLTTIEAHLNALNVDMPYATAADVQQHPFAEFDALLLEHVTMLRPAMRAYAPDESQSLRVDQAVLERCQRLYDQFQRILAYRTWIETDIHGVEVGLTTVDWGGDFTNVWIRHANADQRQAHMDAVRVALRSRQTTMQLIVVVCAGALGLALKAGIPGGQLLLLPFVYDYVRDVLQAWKDWRANHQGQELG